jgi:hypothetical protein
MSEAEVVDPIADGVDKEEKWPPCFGEWDSNYEDCTKICMMRVQCERHTKMAPTPAPVPPPVEQVENLPEMSPHEFLIESLNGKFDQVDEYKEGRKAKYNCYKNGAPVVQIQCLDDGRYFFRGAKAKLELNELESTKQVLGIISIFSV